MPYVNKSEVNDFIIATNQLLGSLVNKTTEFIPLGPEYSVIECSQEVRKHLQLHRLHKKFSVPDIKISLADKSVRNMLEYDREGLKTFIPARMQLHPDVRRLLYKTRLKLHEIFSNFRLSHTDLSLPNGETDLSRRGDCSIYAKLRTAKQWRVTSSCFDLAASIIYQSPWLKRCAKDLMPKYSKSENSLLWLAFGSPFEVFKNKLLDFVTIVDGSRIATVPKNNDEDRVINEEPFLNMMVQLTISNGIRKRLIKEFGYDLLSAQDRHREMISNLNCATIDLSKASDSNWMCVIEWLYPKRFVKLLTNARSPGGSYKGDFHLFNMLSPMGNGFTFEVMTTTLLALARQIDEHSSVFGDDIIIDKNVTTLYIDTLTSIGYRVNTSKTFLSGNFRESCGAYFHKDQYLETYDFWYAENIIDAIVNINKLILTCDVFGIRTELIEFLRGSTPLQLQKEGKATLASGYISVPEDLYKVKRYKRKVNSWTRVIPLYKNRCQDDILCYTYDHRKVDFYVNMELLSHDYISIGKWKKVPQDDLKNRSLIAYYLYSGMCTAPTIRNKTRIKETLVVY